MTEIAELAANSPGGETSPSSPAAADVSSGTEPLSSSSVSTSSSKNLESKICGVCGDKALGYNFNAITCESCKAFFRRNALKKKEFKCPFSDNCKVDVITRRFCQKCRLKKCFDIGMKKEWIMTDEEKKLKKQKIEENRNKRQLDVVGVRHHLTSSSSAMTNSSPSSSLSMSSPPPPSSTASGRLQSASPTRNTTVTSGGDDSMSFSPPSVPPPLQQLRSPPSDEHHNWTEQQQPPSKMGRTSEEHSDVHCPTPASVISEHDVISIASVTSVQSPASSISSGGGALSVLSPQPPLSVVSSLSSPGGPISNPPSVSQNCFPPSPIHSVDSKMASTSSAICTPLSPPSSVSSMSSSSDLLLIKGQECGNSGSSAVCYGSSFSSSIFNTVDTVLNVAIKTEYCSSDDYDSTESTISNVSSLSEMEKTRLRELVIANKAMKSPVQHDPRIMGATADPSLLNVINMTDIAIRRLIKMSKKMSGFKHLCQEDQIALLKGGCTELMILRSVMTYDPEKDCWNYPKTFCIKLDVLREAKGNVYEEHKRFIQSFEPSWRTDEITMLILGAITLFNPARPNVVHTEVIKAEQESYFVLLRRYLESRFLGCEARVTYLKLVQKLDELHILNENHVRVFLDVNPKDVEPLLIEIFDLKNH